ncbi:transporter substrate-binding protein [Geobacillus sp. LEMMJ02]|uniref:Sigma-54-dependent Fis family transcriptional regulator n=1 Tax=Bacillus caldolyticus TaxID=1394 RepID=A0ABN5FVY8_BACCL|nr:MULTISPECIES: transporter substrate-binding protein [Geobacillus]AUI37048.1 sigma-54-dependent Fis family transcriptional regulator [[Bacillus] caldolyticus]TRY34267.1 transporter substrate-binding protein [Geobacillus sp. LEMMJ02]
MNICIGLLFSLTGITSLTEIGQYQAAAYALEKFQKDYSKSNISFTYEVRDIRSDPIESYRQALDMARSGIKVFVGCYTSACRKAILPVLEQYDCFLIYPALYEGQEIHPNVFYVGEIPNQQIASLLKFTVEQFGKKVYLIGNDYVYPRYTNQQVREMLYELDGTVIGEKYVPLGHKEFSTYFEEIKHSSPNAILSTLVGESILPFYKTYYELGLNPEEMPIISPITTELEIRAMGPKYVAGHYSCFSYFQSLDIPENHLFVKGMKAKYGLDTVISSVMCNTYIGIQIVLDAICHLQSTDRKKIVKYLYQKEFSSPSGKIKIESNHHLSREVRIGKAKENGQFEIVWSSGQQISARPLLTNTLLDSMDEEEIWKVLVEEIGKEVSDGIIVVDQNNKILYMNPYAYSVTRAKQGDVLDDAHLSDIGYEVTKREVKKSYHVFLIFIKKTSVQSPSCGIPSKNKYQFGNIVTYNQAFQKELHIASIASQFDTNVLILGETGTGKEVLARTIHEQSHRRNGPFIALNAGAIPRELIASELFGYVEGAFTGSKKGGSIGKFEAANGGTLFLDEIGEMPLELQVSLLRVLEERKIVRIGDYKERPVNVRVIAATNRNLKEEIAYQGSFRSDLYYRLNVFTIHVPPLRHRIEDIPDLSMQFLHQFHQYYGKGPLELCDSALQMLQSYHWPGNIRELKNVMERAFLLAINEPKILPLHLPEDFQNFSTIKQSHLAGNLKYMEKQMIEQVLQETKNITEAAKILGVTRSTLYRKMNKWNIRKKHFKSSSS